MTQNEITALLRVNRACRKLLIDFEGDDDPYIRELCDKARLAIEMSDRMRKGKSDEAL